MLNFQKDALLIDADADDTRRPFLKSILTHINLLHGNCSNKYIEHRTVLKTSPVGVVGLM